MTLFEAQRWWIPFYFFFWASSFQRDCSPKGPILFASQKALLILSLACSPMERLSSPLLSLTYIPCSPFPSSSIDSSSSLASFFSFYPSYPTLLFQWENPSSLSYSPTGKASITHDGVSRHNCTAKQELPTSNQINLDNALPFVFTRTYAHHKFQRCVVSSSIATKPPHESLKVLNKPLSQKCKGSLIILIHTFLV